MAAGVIAVPTARYLLDDRTPVFIARNQRYDANLEQTIRDGILAAGVDTGALKGKRVLLKPNMVEPTRQAPHMTTHPAVVIAAAEVFGGWGAAVTVGEAPGHLRDTDLALFESGIGEALQAAKIPFADLNYETTQWVENGGGASTLKGFHFPRSVVEADLIVSMPKIKTHHWIGVTASMKNLYGVIPGIRYGWPKNVLHYNGIPETVFDINASLPKCIAIVDGIDCMEGDGPIMGSPKHMGVLLVGSVPAAVDATICRLMDLLPQQIGYLDYAKGKLGPLAEEKIVQRGEDWEPLVQTFDVLDKPHLRHLTAHRDIKAS